MSTSIADAKARALEIAQRLASKLGTTASLGDNNSSTGCKTNYHNNNHFCNLSISSQSFLILLFSTLLRADTRNFLLCLISSHRFYSGELKKKIVNDERCEIEVENKFLHSVKHNNNNCQNCSSLSSSLLFFASNVFLFCLFINFYSCHCFIKSLIFLTHSN